MGGSCLHGQEHHNNMYNHGAAEFFLCTGVTSTIGERQCPTICEYEIFAIHDGNGIRHKRVPPYHPASNGMAERMIQKQNNGS